jgi:Sporulation and spore germination
MRTITGFISIWLVLPLLAVTQTAAAAQGVPAPAVVELPRAGARAPLPLHVVARVGRPGERAEVVLRWADGARLASRATLLAGQDGRGLLITSLDWAAGDPTPRPDTQPAWLEVRDADGALRTQQAITVLAPGDPQTQAVTLYWTGGEDVRPARRWIARTQAVGDAAMQELLWGPGPGDPPELTTALPLPPEVLGYAGRQAGWGARVGVRKLDISQGVARVDLSRELEAFGGGALRAGLIRRQIEHTLRQFPSVRAVRITVDGEAGGVLEP